MKLKELESLMQDIAPFASPKIELEQYPTGPHLAARLLYTVAHAYDEFEGMVVVDLGCGTAMLSIGAAILGACHVIGIDIDPDALEIARENVEEFEDSMPIDLVHCPVQALAGLPRLRADTVIMNPPFGTRQKGADIEFLRAAFAISDHSVYSLHKSSTRRHIERVALRELDAATAEVVAQLRYDLPASYKFHKEKSKDIDVDLWRFEVGGKKRQLQDKAVQRETRSAAAAAADDGEELLQQEGMGRRVQREEDSESDDGSSEEDEEESQQ